jgi:hypothetical protein
MMNMPGMTHYGIFSPALASTPTPSTLEAVGGSYYFLDETALGRQEDWEEPKSRAVVARGAVPDFSS